MKKNILIIILCLTMVFVTACGGSGAKEEGVKNYSIGTSAVGGNFYLMGGGIATTINKHLEDDFMFTAETTGGSTANLTMLQNGDAELGIAMTSALAEAFEGTEEWTAGEKHDKIRSVMGLYPSWLTVYTAANSGIETMEDVEGKIIGLGGKGMSMNSVFREFLKERGINPKQIHNDGHAATATALKDKVIDVALLFGYPPFAAISELESTLDLTFIPLTEDEQDFLVNKHNFYARDFLPGGYYKGAPEDVLSVSEWNMLVSSSDVPEEDVYKIVKHLCEDQEDMIAVHPSAEYMTVENILSSNIYLHAGVVRYLEEEGIEIPSELIPPEYKK